MIDPDVRSAMLNKKLVAIEEYGSVLILRFHDGGQFVVKSDWKDDPNTLDPAPLPPVIDFVLYGERKTD